MTTSTGGGQSDDHGSGEPIRYAEDLAIGRSFELGEYDVRREEIIAFAAQWDPQAFHVDTAVASAGRFGDVIASGAHTLSIFQRLAALAEFRRWAVIAGRQIRSLVFEAPVRPGMTLRGRMVVLSVAPDKPGRSLVRLRGELVAGDDVVISLESELLVSNRRQPAAADSRNSSTPVRS